VFVAGIEWVSPSGLEEACELSARLGRRARFLAGGTDLVVDLKTGRTRADHVISLNRIAELRGITTDENGLHAAALTTPNQLARFPAVRSHFAPLLDAACEMAAPQVRNMATIGGNIASAIPSADLPPILMVMGARITLQSPSGSRTLPLEKFFRGPRESVRRDDEILTAVHVPHAPAGFGAAYVRFALRAANACAVAGVAVGLRVSGDGEITDARVALAAVAPTPTLVDAASGELVGRPPNQAVFDRAAEAAMAAARPIGDIRGSADFRRRLVGVLTGRALAAALTRAREPHP
jgi:carbon-monoxide dehydrogenase medium subunit